MLSFALTIGVLGCVAFLFALRGWRSGDSPHCRKCNYDVTGIARSLLCPECGRSLGANNAVRAGARKRRPRIAAASMLVVLVGAGGVVYSTFGSSQRLNSYKPVSLLSFEIRRGASMSATAAATELMTRVGNGTVDVSVLTPLIDRAIQEYPATVPNVAIDYLEKTRPVKLGQFGSGQYQPTQTKGQPPPVPAPIPAAPTRPAVDPWVELLVFAHDHQLMTEQQRVALLSDGLGRLSMRSVSRTVVGQPVSIGTPHFSMQDAVLLVFGEIELTFTHLEFGLDQRRIPVQIVDDQEQTALLKNVLTQRPMNSGYTLPLQTSQVNDALIALFSQNTTGLHDLDVDVRIEVNRPVFSEQAIEQLAGPYTVVQQVEVFDTPEDAITVVRAIDGMPPPELDVLPFINHATGMTEERKLKVKSVSDTGDVVLLMDFAYAQDNQQQVSMLYVAADIVLRSGGREWPALAPNATTEIPSFITVSSSSYYRSHRVKVLGLPTEMTHVDVVFKPNLVRVLKLSHISSVWADEIIIPNVPIQWPDADDPP